MHEIYAARNGEARIEIISNPASQVERKREVLPLRPLHPFGFLSVNIPEAKAEVEVGRNSPVRSDKITPNPHVVRPIPSFRSPRNRGEGPAESHIPISPQDPRPSYVAHVPSQRSNVGFQRVVKPSHVIPAACEEVERPRDIDGKPPVLKGDFKLVLVIDGSVEIRPLSFLRFSSAFARRLGC